MGGLGVLIRIMYFELWSSAPWIVGIDVWFVLVSMRALLLQAVG